MTVNNEVTAADIARIAGVGRAAVSNWRRRHPDFPAPIGGSPTSPTFALADVEAWLVANGRATGVNTAETRRGGAPDTGIVQSMAALLPPLARGTVLDPACGDGSVLVAAAQRLGPRVHYAGQDSDPAQVEQARTALAEAGAGKAEIRVADLDVDESATFPADAADAVISLPLADPILPETMTWEYGQPSRQDTALAWVQICLSYLKPGGVAVVAVPFAVAVRASARRIRAELLRAGVLTHVIGLPEKAVAGTTVPWQIWMLTRPAARPAYVLRMVDLVDRAPDELPRDEKAWSEVFADPARTRDLPSIELLDEDVFLVPAAHTAEDAHDVKPEYVALRKRYAASVRRLADVAPTLTAAKGAEPIGPLVTISDLARSGAVSFVDRNAARPGDVVVPAGGGGFDAVVVGETAEAGVGYLSVLRCDPDVLDPYFLACFLRSESNRRQAAGTSGGTFRLDVRRARVPRMPLPEQRRYGEAFRRLTGFAGGAEEVAAAAAAATRTAIRGLTSGIFAPDEDRK